MKKIKICRVCRKYTLQKSHCNAACLSAHPAPFNPNDKWGNYRRQAYGIAI